MAEPEPEPEPDGFVAPTPVPETETGAPGGDDRVVDRSRVVVFSGGEPLSGEAAARLEPGAFVVAADSGLEQAQAHGWPVDVAVGDFDSVDPAALARAEASGTRVERHPAAKDATDLSLALAIAAALEPRRIVVADGGGGRLDHLLGGLLALTDEAYAGIRMSAVVGPAQVHVVRDRLELDADPGDLVTLLVVGAPAHGVTTGGLRYPLDHETLHPASTRGVSNVVVDRPAWVQVADGVLLVVLPGPEPLDPTRPVGPAAPAAPRP